jgi:glycosyltransferase involved in cell wall biosynthesis/SAM-dependent methyltransferase
VVDESPLVSVVVIFLDEERYLGEAVESVLAQTYDAWELLLVDDGSTDGSTELARAYADREPGRVRYLEHPGHRNLGMSASRNRGLREARGEYVAFLDADDIWMPAKLADQVALIEAHPMAAAAYGPSEWWYSWTGDPADARRDFIYPLGVETERVIQPPSLLTSYLKRQATTPCPSSILVRREVAIGVGGFEESFCGDAQLYEDQVFLAKLHTAVPVVVGTACWTRYRQRPDSCVASVKRAGGDRAVRRRFLAWLEGYLRSKGIMDPELWSAVRSASWKARHPGLDRSVTRAAAAATALLTIMTPMLRRTVPAEARRRLGQMLHMRDRPPVGMVRFGSLRRVTPISRCFGYDRGIPIDRYYVERFLEANAPAIRGRVLEIGDDAYTHRFGAERVARSDVLHVSPDNPRATIVADLANADHVPSNAFDCIILTQTLHLIFDLAAAVATIHRILKPGGALLATFPGISQVSDDEWADTWYWSLTSRATQRLFTESFGSANVHIEVFGNVLAASSFLYGLAASELRRSELEYRDPTYELLITVKAVKEGAAP